LIISQDIPYIKSDFKPSNGSKILALESNQKSAIKKKRHHQKKSMMPFQPKQKQDCFYPNLYLKFGLMC
jgi:hypothetical protein